MSDRRAVSAVLTCLVAGVAGCDTGCNGRGRGTTNAPTNTQPSAAPPSTTTPAPVVAAPPAADAGADGGPLLSAIVFNGPIFSEMERPDRRPEHENKVILLGSLRWGEKAPVLPEPHVKPGCKEGWYELAAGGYVCGQYVTLDMDHPKVKAAPAPDLDGPLPYKYGINLVNGTPLYHHIPTREQRKKGERWLFEKKKVKVDDDNPYGTWTGGGASPDASVPDAGEDEWWTQEIPDGGQPDVKIDDLKHGDGAAIAQRMVKGFYVSVDQQVDALGEKWWQTVSGLVAPAYRVMPAKTGTEFHGVWLGKDDATFPTKSNPSRRIDKLPVAFVTALYGNPKRWNLDEGRKNATAVPDAPPLERYQAIGLTGEKARVAGTDYWETDGGWWMRANDGTKTEPGSPPTGLGDHEKWIDVNLRRQTLVAFEGPQAVFVTMFSSGRNDHETPPGSFRIREKHISATMDGDADIAADGPYSIEDVPYIEYFNAGYALHGAFWHYSFGFVKSHGCVNLAPWDAKGIFGWTEPALPKGWHAVVATKDKPGTRVIVHERGPGTCETPDAGPPKCPDLDESHSFRH